MKNCGRCKKEKPLSEFNKDKYSKTGYRSQCKECMTAERLRLRDHYKEWRSTDERKSIYRQYRKARYEKDRLKIKARNASRVLKRMPCEVCGNEKVEAHHDDYAKPLNVRWLCQAHHKQWHRDNGEGKNAT